MRRHLVRYIPVFMLALMVQIVAPIGACLAVAVAAADPLAAAEICHSDQAANPGPLGQGEHRSHDGACAICCGLNASAAPANTPEAVAFVVPRREAEGVVWRDTAPDLAVSRSGSNAQARAPPVLV